MSSGGLARRHGGLTDRFAAAALYLIICLMATYGTVHGQVSPEMQLAARGVMSFNVDDKANSTASAVNDFSDSSLLIGFRQKLYSEYRSQMVMGFQFPDADSDLGQVFFHQMFLKVENRVNILKMGRSRVRSALIEFPTLRDDDALQFTDVLNPFSNGRNSEDNQFGNVLEVAHLFGQRTWLRLHGEHFTKSPPSSFASEDDFSLNAIGASFVYEVPESQRWNRALLNQAGISTNNFLPDRDDYSGADDQVLQNIIVSAVLNIRPDPVYFWDLRHQTIYNAGIEGINQLADYADMTRARSLATFTSVRYLYRRYERPTAQLSASLGYKTFPELTRKTSQW
ncbi:MAG: hypothetical protein IID15_04910, partial [Candidatus Marinimicrobia bacterium]|nr:hypothetical protein [Candidatus Neomarinimicrobiota bacterium]